MAVHPWSALQRPLAFAARQNFAELESVADLGPTLRRAAAGLASLAPAPLAAELRAFLEALQDFEAADRASRIRLVARGLRLCAEAAGHFPGAVKTPAATKRGARSSRPVVAGREPAGGDGDQPVGLQAPLTSLRGVGPAIAARLAARGLLTVEDLLGFLPLDYLDRREQRALSTVTLELEGQVVTTRGVVVAVSRGRPRGRARRLELGLAEAAGEPRQLSCVWFRAHRGLAERFPRGTAVWVSGRVGRYQDRVQLVHPDIGEERDGEGGAGLRCRYPEVEGVAPRVIEQLCRQACGGHVEEVEDAVPAWVAGERQLLSQAAALRWLHLCLDGPDPEAAVVQRLRRGEHEAQRRLVFDELFSLELAVGLRRADWERGRAFACPAPDPAALSACFPFPLTGAQQRVIAEIHAAMSRQRPMHRLLQGDVGSGKTAVAFAAAHAAMAAGLQAAVMAPTELLARQHFQVMEGWCRQLGLRCALLTGETPPAARASLLALADGGAVQLLVGTHALLSRQLNLPNLALAVVDEQHRFGVAQRARLRDHGEEQPLPHLLVMTATPIPRTLALSLYGDLDLSVLDEKPPGRRPALTQLFLEKQRQTAYRIVEEQLAAGQQAFVVCPLVEESEAAPAADAVGTAERLRARFPDRRIGLVHGRMPAAERDRTMAAFRARQIDLLVATTVIEVGIDVPTANVMVIEQAERFGLAQLHQLRGRVGRGLAESHCLLLSGQPADSPAGQRLAALVRSDDGFVIAEEDLALRGPGEVFGTRQAGIPRLRFADLRRHLGLLGEAREAAGRLLARDPQLAAPEHQMALRVMRRRWERLPLVGAEAG